MNSKIFDTISLSILDINAQSSDNKAIAVDKSTVLLGGEEGMESLTFVNFIVALEQRIEENFGVSLTLVDEASMGDDENPFSTVSSLINYVEKLLSNASSL